MAEHPRNDDVVLEQPHAEHDEAGRERLERALRQPDADRERAGDERPDHRHDLEHARERPDQQPVRQSDRPEAAREQDRDEADQNELSADEGAELLVDQHPGVAHDSPVLARRKSLHERNRVVAFEDPVGADCEHEEDADEHLERRLRHRERRMHQCASRGQPAQLFVDAREDVVLDPGRVRRLVVDVRRADRLLHLIDRARTTSQRKSAISPRRTA